MKAFPKVILIMLVWILPILIFPSSTAGLLPEHGFAEYHQKGFDPVCYTPVFVSLAYAEPAPLFLNSGNSYILCPHWKYWFIWIGLAAAISIFLRKSSTQRTMIPDNESMRLAVDSKFNFIIFTTGCVYSALAITLMILGGTLILVSRFPNMTTDQAMPFLKAFLSPILVFSFLFWVEASIKRPIKGQKLVLAAFFILAISLIYWGFPPAFATAAFLGKSGFFCIFICLGAIALSFPLEKASQKISNPTLALFIYKGSLYSLISGSFVAQMLLW